MKLIFLDFDGVLNSYPFLIGKPPTGPAAIDRAAIERLNTIFLATNAKFVISSSWRCCSTREELTDWLRGHGFNGEVIGLTPERPYRGRGAEIDAWLTEHGSDPEGDAIEAFVILDDNSDMKPHGARLVQTDAHYGLTDADVICVIDKLRT